MVNKTQITLGFILLTILASGIVYIQLTDQVKIRVDEDQTTFYVPHEDYSWIWTVAGREQNRLFDGTSIMYRDKSGITVNNTYNNNTNEVWIERVTPYQRGPVIKDLYYFDGDIEAEELFPISHTIEVYNGSGYFYRYAADDLTDVESKRKLDGNETHLEFGKNMELDLQSGYRWAWVGWPYGPDSVAAQYDIDSDYEKYEIRLFDPSSWTENLNEGLEGFYKFNETSGTNAEESVFGSNNFTMNSDNWVDGIIGNSYEAKGSDFIDTQLDFFGADGVTASIWVYRTGAMTDDHIFHNSDSGNPDSDGECEFREWIGDTNFRLRCYDDSSLKQNVCNNLTPSEEWTHYVITMNSSSSRIYWNGGLCSEISLSNFNISNADNNFGFLDRHGGGQPLNNALVDELGFWNETLSASEVEDLYNSGDGITYEKAAVDSCDCPGADSNWELNMSDYCNITSNCNLGTGNINWTGTGTTLFNASINTTNMEYPSTDQKLNIGSNGLLKVG